MKHLFITLFILLLLPLELLYSQSLTVLYFKRPPYYDTVNNLPDGFLVELTRRIFEKADIAPTFIEVPPSRIMHYIKDPNKKVCSIGWFKNKEREEFAKFSEPIYQNKPLVVLTTRSKQHLLEQHATIKDVFSDRSLILAAIDSFSYGAIMDKWINNYAPNVHEISSDQSLLPRLIISNRASYMLVAPEEISMMLQQATLDETLFVSITKPDIPAGNKRYLIFSKRVENSLIEDINTAIQSLVPPQNQ
ncbi:MAG: transporter substrate-binding domain-containing protein [Proteobacteria bacterium]|nr:transporter substrate-binding domain-containing protein [Pseudomonadota bacterium]MBU1584995.1 transporter substrate-binding domain-containing protein [Pseudomonadota bacterium]MBU2454442.1 transporter substrate-binding domain-containing protein [Pseudomonadota bacterium]MBU2631643.1 transporter substrate-binding domain-containing protein [Pseudomonadota bacterium]